jgi:hypothetical protein
MQRLGTGTPTEAKGVITQIGDLLKRVDIYDRHLAYELTKDNRMCSRTGTL